MIYIDDRYVPYSLRRVYNIIIEYFQTHNTQIFFLQHCCSVIRPDVDDVSRISNSYQLYKIIIRLAGSSKRLQAGRRNISMVEKIVNYSLFFP